MLLSPVVSLLLAAVISGQAAYQSKTLKVPLHKATSEQGGSQGQPLTSYYVKTEFGTPPKSFNMLVDVEGRETWLPHRLTMGLVFSRLNYKNGYRKKDSSTSRKEPEVEYDIDYNGCKLTGKAYTDVVHLSEASGSQPARIEQRFLAMSSASNDKFSKHSHVDGVLAFNPWPISETGSDLLVVAMKRANLTSELEFGLKLNSDENTDEGGELIIGGFDPIRAQRAPRAHQSLNQHKWELALDRVSLGSESLGPCQSPLGDDPCKAALSTISNDIYGPPEVVMSLLKLIGVENVDKKSSIFGIDCLKVANAPTLSFTFSGVQYSIPPTSYIKKKFDGILFKSSTCYVGLLPNPSGNKWELGTGFLSNFYTMFDMKNRSVSFVRYE